VREGREGVEGTRQHAAGALWAIDLTIAEVEAREDSDLDGRLRKLKYVRELLEGKGRRGERALASELVAIKSTRAAMSSAEVFRKALSLLAFAAGVTFAG
jgi:hypothetical protein